MIRALIFLVPLAFVMWVAWSYYITTGTVAERLASATRSSMTILAAIGAALTTAMTQTLDLIAQLSGDPQIAAYGATIKAAIPPQYAGLIPLAGFAIVIWARTRTMGK